MWQRLATSELISTFFPTWLRRSKNGYWLNTAAHPVTSSYYIPQFFVSVANVVFNTGGKIDRAYKIFLLFLLAHIIFSFYAWYLLFNTWSNNGAALFGALTLTFGAYSLKQQPCIIYTLAWFPLTLYHNQVIASIAVGMMLLAGYYPFAIFLIPISFLAHIIWYQEAWVIVGMFIGLPQLVKFIKYLPKTVKRLTDKCETPEVERRFYVGVIPIMLLPFSTSSIWPLLVLSVALSRGWLKNYFPRVHERWLIVVQFSIGWMAVSGLNNLHMSGVNLAIILGLQTFDIYWHNKGCLPPRPYCELYHKPSWAFNTRLTRFLESNLNGYRVAGLPHPLFTGLINGFKTMGYQGSMQLKLMAKWRGTSGSHGIEGLDEEAVTLYRVKYAWSRTRPYSWEPTEVRFLWRNPAI